jgi:starvation-inducible DNA-binding protein
MAALVIESRYNSDMIAEHLNKLLATTEHFYMIYKHYHWNVVDKHFYQLHLLFDKHAGEIHETLDTVAERIRQMGKIADGRLETYGNTSALNPKLQQGNDRDKILDHLLEQHNKYIALVEELIDYVTTEKDYATADMLTGFLETQQQQRWFISASID